MITMIVFHLKLVVQSIDWTNPFTKLNLNKWMGAYPLSKLFQILSTQKLKTVLLKSM